MANDIKQVTNVNGGKFNLGDIEKAAIRGVEQGKNAIELLYGGVHRETGDEAFTIKEDINFLIFAGNVTSSRVITLPVARAGRHIKLFWEVEQAGNDRVLIGTTASRTLSGVIPNLFKEGTGYNDSSMALVGNTGTSAGAAPLLLFGRSRGTSNGTSTSVASGDRLGGIFFTGADGTDIESLAAVIQAKVDGTPGSNDMPGRLEFYTTPDGSESTLERI